MEATDEKGTRIMIYILFDEDKPGFVCRGGRRGRGFFRQRRFAGRCTGRWTGSCTR